MSTSQAFFLLFLGATFILAAIAARRAGKASQFYAAGHSVHPVQNGLALAGDYVSAGSFLGVTGVMYSGGFEGLLIPMAALTGWPLMMMVFAERMRRLGRYTLVDVLRYRLNGHGICVAASVSVLCINIIYAVAQLVGAGKLLSLLLGIGYVPALVLMSTLIALFVVMGGMLIITWIQMLKATLVLAGAAVLCALILAHFGFSLNRLFAAAVDLHARHEAILRPGLSYFADPLAGVSLSMGLMLGSAGMPHVVIRFFTAPNPRAARGAVFWGTVFIAGFYIVLIIIGFGAIGIVLADPAVRAAGGMPRGGTNMVVMHLTRMVGGEAFFGFMAAVSFATILAVVSGIAISAAVTLSHDLARTVLPKLVATERREIMVSRIGAVLVSGSALLLAVIFESQNVAILASLVLGLASAANVPVLFMAIYWRGLTPRGATWGIVTGLVMWLVLFVLGPVVMIDSLKMDHAIVAFANPTLLAMLATIIAAWGLSVTDRSKLAEAARGAFPAQERASEGI